MGSHLAAALGIVAALAAAGSAHAGTAEDQIRAVLDGMNTSYNSADFDAFAAHVCAAMRHADGFEAGWHQSRRTDGPTRISVNSVDVADDQGAGAVAKAIANVRFEAVDHAETLDVDFVREGAQWKACRYHAGQTV